jgi:plasmid stabilization system protein ParE
MSKQFRFHPEAQNEVRESARWYRDRSPRAAVEFRVAVSDAVHSVIRAPQRWSKYLHGTRRLILDTFPFSIVYLDDPDSVKIVAVAHHKRRPGVLERAALGAGFVDERKRFGARGVQF